MIIERNNNDELFDFGDPSIGNLPVLIKPAPPQIYDPIVLPQTAQYRFVDSKTGNVISSVKISEVYKDQISGQNNLQGLGSLITSNGSIVFNYSQAKSNYVATSPNYKAKSFTPQIGKTTTVYLDKIIKSQYRFVDSKTGNVISSVKLSEIYADQIDAQNNLQGLGYPTVANGIYTFTGSDIDKYYQTMVLGYNTNNFKVVEHSGITTVTLTPQTATVKFVDAKSKAVINNVVVDTGLQGLGVSYANNNGVFNFTFQPLDKSKTYFVSANGYKKQAVLVSPGQSKVIQLTPVDIPVDIPVVDPAIEARNRARYKAKTKAKARLRILLLT